MNLHYPLTERPWIPVLTDTGMDLCNLMSVFDNDVLTVASGDPLEDAAILRLLLAIRIAAGARRQTPQDWVAAHAARFDLFSPSRPFGQNPDMARLVNLKAITRPLSAQSYSLAGNGSTAPNQFHTRSGVTFDPAGAARLLLMRQAFSVGGIQQFPKTAYGSGPLSAKTSVCTNRAFVWIDTGRLASTLDVNATSVADRPLGTFHFGWPDPALAPPIVGEPRGVLDALTWPSRSIYLLPGTEVTEVMICDGLRWPDSESPGYRPSLDVELIPHAVFACKSQKAPLAVQGVHIDRAPWRQLLAGLSSGIQPPGSVLNAALTAELPADSMVRIAGLGSYQSRIDGPITGAFPIPARGVDLPALSALLNDAFTRHGSYFGALAHTTGLTEGDKSAALVRRVSRYTALLAQLEPIARAAAVREISIEQARERVNTAVESANRYALDQFRRVHSSAAGRVVARKEAWAASGGWVAFSRDKSRPAELSKEKR